MATLDDNPGIRGVEDATREERSMDIPDDVRQAIQAHLGYTVQDREAA